MSTWAELRQEILFTLGDSPSATTNSDVRNTVDIKLKRKRDEIYGRRPPKSLLVWDGPVSVPSDLEYIKIEGASGGSTQPSFGVTDYWRTFGLSVALSTEDDVNNAEDWEPVDWDTWIRSNSSIEGNQRLSCTFAQDYQKFIYMRNLPGTGTTWNAWLHYYKQPATISDGGTPEIGQEYESLLVFGVALQFPNLFRGDERAAMYAAMYREYDNLLKEYLRASTAKRGMMRFRPFRKRTADPSVFWGTGETS